MKNKRKKKRGCCQSPEVDLIVAIQILLNSWVGVDSTRCYCLFDWGFTGVHTCSQEIEEGILNQSFEALTQGVDDMS